MKLPAVNRIFHRDALENASGADEQDRAPRVDGAAQPIKRTLASRLEGLKAATLTAPSAHRFRTADRAPSMEVRVDEICRFAALLPLRPANKQRSDVTMILRRFVVSPKPVTLGPIDFELQAKPLAVLARQLGKLAPEIRFDTFSQVEYRFVKLVEFYLERVEEPTLKAVMGLCHVRDALAEQIPQLPEDTRNLAAHGLMTSAIAGVIKRMPESPISEKVGASLLLRAGNVQISQYGGDGQSAARSFRTSNDDLQ
ncbi:hypothetical protein LJR230_004485 [Trinickia sp. LjRoot230]|uniref:hypothetical protein n=1 Tax=Trinickia sp. LjRoot230 TaxID=3342288 RepID=UPI003ECE8FA2